MRTLILLACAMASAPAAAAVTSSADNGFEVSSSVTVPATPETAWAALILPSHWWDGAHSWSGSAANLSLDPHVGGCFCDAMPGGGGVENGRVIAVMPGKLLRMSGALGPFQEHGVAGTLSFALKPVPGGTSITFSYAAGGYMPSGMKDIAPIADSVISDQLKRLAALLGH